jgi:biopolymer transport protein ExbD
MAEINTGDSGEGKKNKPKKQNLRVDFTPMVDMNMLLITFFMFCTTLSKPQIMNLVVPSKDKNEIVDDKPKTADSRTTTVILAGDNVVYYYFGKPNYEDYTSLVKTDYSPEGLRAVLVGKNGDVIRQMAELRGQRQREEITEDEFKTRSSELKSDKEGQTVIIKPTAESTYENLVNALDEMQICSIGIYALVEPAEVDDFLIQNYLQQGALTGQIDVTALNK